MKKHNKLIVLGLAGVLVFGTVFPHAACGITIREEEELSKEVLSIVRSQYEIIDDPVIVRYIRRLGKKIVSVLPPQPFTYHFYVIMDDTLNAFATPAGHIFVNSGLIAALENEDELAGILAHEVAHVVCRHISQKIDSSKKASLATLAGIAAGALIGIAGGPGGAAQALTAGAMAASQSVMLAYSREDEIQADQRGLDYLTKTGFDCSGLLTSLKKMRNKQWFGSDQIPKYLMTHPASEDRIAYIGGWLDTHPDRCRIDSQGNAYDYNIAKIRLIGLYQEKDISVKRMKSAVDDHPDDPLSHYGYGLALARTGNRKEAALHVKRALEKRPFDAFILTDLGRIYFLDGRFQDAVKLLEGAVSIEPRYPEALLYLAKVHLEQGEFEKAAARLETLIATAPGYNRAYYSLGMAYGKQGRMGEAHYYLGIFFLNGRSVQKARFHLERASQTITDPEKLSRINEILEMLNKGSKNPEKGRG